MIRVQIVGKNKRVIEATDNGEFVTAPIAYSTGKFQEMDAINTAFNFHKPKVGKLFVITAFIISANRNVGVNGAAIEFYEANSAGTITVGETILKLDMAKNDILPIIGINSILSEGAFLNGKTDDASVLVTIAGYEVDA